MNKNFIDVTNEWLKNATPNSHVVKEQLYYADSNKKKYIVDGKNIVLDYSDQEKEIALWVANTFGGKIYMIPKVNIPWGIKTPDYLWNNEYWDLKQIAFAGKNVIDNRLNKSKNQSTNFILDVTNNKLSNKNIINQIKKVYNSEKRNWVDKIIVKRNQSVILVIIRKK